MAATVRVPRRVGVGLGRAAGRPHPQRRRRPRPRAAGLPVLPHGGHWLINVAYAMPFVVMLGWMG